MTATGGPASAAASYSNAPLLQRMVRRTAATAPVSWLYARLLHHLDRVVFRLTRGRATVASWLSGLPVVMLTTTGARTGQPRTVPVLGLPLAGPLPPRGTPGPIAVIASNWGRAHHPGWMHNLTAHSAAQLAVGGTRWPVRGRRVGEDERVAIWQAGLRVYPGWATYARRAAEREIAVFVLEPAG